MTHLTIARLTMAGESLAVEHGASRVADGVLAPCPASLVAPREGSKKPHDAESNVSISNRSMGAILAHFDPNA